MHSSRMHTGRSLTVCCSLLPWGGLVLGGLPGPGGVSLVLGGMSAWSRGVWSQGVSLWSGGVSLAPGGVCLVPGGFSFVAGGLPGPGGFSLVWGVSLVLGGFSGDPPVNRITDTCKNITLATTSLRPVNILKLWVCFS